MSERERAPFGCWASPITPAVAAAGGMRLGDVRTVDGAVYWIESRPAEKGRGVICLRELGGEPTDAVPAEVAVRTKAHEYGGGAFTMFERTLYYSDDASQRLVRLEPGGDPTPITDTPGARYADGRVTPDGRWLICVRELHVGGPEPTNTLVVVPTDGSSAERVIAEGRDFYSFPRVNPDGTRLAWTEWDHPNMPWDGTELRVAELRADGTLGASRLVAGGPEESVFQPDWSPSGALHFVSDRTGWWNLYRADRDGAKALCPMEAEYGVPQWIFGLSTYAFLADDRIACVRQASGLDHLAVLDPETGELEAVDVPFTSYGSHLLCSDGMTIACVAATADRAPAVVTIDPVSGMVDIVRESFVGEIDPAWISTPQPIEFPTEGGRVAHAIYYPPASGEYTGPEDERPPLIVKSHGGPTAASSTAFDAGIQFWTSRGFAVVDVNYGGSTGYGRAYRKRLEGNWGIVDVDDCVNAARWLAERGDVDGERMAIRGGSAGGFTTLCALAFKDAFSAGASYYGVADIEALIADTHKFESRYEHTLIGSQSEVHDLFRERSPVHHASGISCPVIFFQGLDDKVVPPEQTRLMARALFESGVPHVVVEFEGEGHGFRRAESLQTALGSELAFYAKVFGLSPPEVLPTLKWEKR